jgi:tetratricopeptide (TPR) repeat protein
MTGVFLFCGSAGFTAIQHFAAEVACPTVWNSTLNLNWNPLREDIEKAIALNPGNAEYHYLRALNLIDTKHADADRAASVPLGAVESLKQAVRLNPIKGTYWYLLGVQYSQKNENLFDYVEKWLPVADRCFDRGVILAPMDSDMLFQTAAYWVWRSRLLQEVEEKSEKPENRLTHKQAGIQKFQKYFQRFLQIKPDSWKKALDLVWADYPDDGIALGIVPEGDGQMRHKVLIELAKRGR